MAEKIFEQTKEREGESEMPWACLLPNAWELRPEDTCTTWVSQAQLPAASQDTGVANRVRISHRHFHMACGYPEYSLNHRVKHSLPRLRLNCSKNQWALA